MTLDAIAIIPARLASTRLPRKPLADLAGSPLIVRVCENAAASGVFSRIIVACDSELVAEVVRGAGFGASLTPAGLPSGTDRVAAVAKTLQLHRDAVVINVQGDEPFVSSASLRALVNAFALGSMQGRRVEIATVIEPCLDLDTLRDPNVVKVAVGSDARALYFSRAAIPYVRDATDPELNEQHFRHVGLYGFRADTLQLLTQLPEHPLERIERLEQLRWLANGHSITCVEAEAGARGIDTALDLERAQLIYAQRFVGMESAPSGT